MPPAPIARSTLRDVFLGLFLAEVGGPSAALPVARLYALWCGSGLRRSDLLETLETLMDAGLLETLEAANDDLYMRLTASGQQLRGGNDAMGQLNQQLTALRRPYQRNEAYINLSTARGGVEVG